MSRVQIQKQVHGQFPCSNRAGDDVDRVYREEAAWETERVKDLREMEKFTTSGPNEKGEKSVTAGTCAG